MHGMDKKREGLERARGREGVFVFAVSRMLQMWVGRVLFDLVGLMNRFAGLAAMELSFFLSKWPLLLLLLLLLGQIVWSCLVLRL